MSDIVIERIPYEGPAFDKKIINSPEELHNELTNFAQALANKLPVNHMVKLHRSGLRSFILTITDIDERPLQKFSIDWDRYNQVNWSPYYD